MADTNPLILKTARELVDAVAFDDCGAVVAGQLVGGHGGLLSRETIKKADALRLALDAHRIEMDKAADAAASMAVEGATA